MKATVIYLAVFCSWAISVSAGEVTGTITRLEGEPRGNTTLTYSVRGRELGAEIGYPIKEETETSTDESGNFRVHWDDGQYRAGTKEVFVLLKSRGLQAVELQYLLGTTTHNTSIVMRESLYRMQMEFLPKMALIRDRNSLQLAGRSGTGMYHVRGESRPRLEAWTHQMSDDRHLRYTEDATSRRWAINKAAKTVYHCHNGHWIRTTYYYVWTLEPGGGSWTGMGWYRSVPAAGADSSGKMVVPTEVQAPLRDDG